MRARQQGRPSYQTLSKPRAHPFQVRHKPHLTFQATAARFHASSCLSVWSSLICLRRSLNSASQASEQAVRCSWTDLRGYGSYKASQISTADCKESKLKVKQQGMDLLTHLYIGVDTIRTGLIIASLPGWKCCKRHRSKATLKKDKESNPVMGSREEER